ncbi:MAG: FRG domain-containing protein [Bacteroidaceae bacterium]|nr:FRG domain-containing protein [Bacteroidaceae bacterium]
MIYLNNPRFKEIPNNENLNEYPTILDILEDIAELEENECATIDPIYRTVITQMLRRGLSIVTKEKGKKEVDLIPSGKNIDILYRGQSRFYENCFPSIYREWTEEKQLLTNLQKSEFILLLDSHPILYDITSKPLYHPQIKEPIWIGINYDGLAQHYGICTNLLDFSNDKWVSAFFAVTSYDGKKDKYNVIRPSNNWEENFGVFYVYQNDYNQSDRQNAYPIGLHYFNRPGAQSGFALPMIKGQNLNTLPFCKKIFFRHDSNANELVYKMNQNSYALFPEDDLVNYVHTIKETNRHFSSKAIEFCYRNHYQNIGRNQFNHLLTQYKIIQVEQSIVSFLEDNTKKEMTKWENGDKMRYINSLIIQPLFQL